MRRYLIKYYPVYPYDELMVVDLDVLKDEFSTKSILENRREMVQQLYDIYQFALTRKHVFKNIVRYNNSNWWIVEAENAIEAVKTIALEEK